MSVAEAADMIRGGLVLSDDARLRAMGHGARSRIGEGKAVGGGEAAGGVGGENLKEKRERGLRDPKRSKDGMDLSQYGGTYKTAKQKEEEDPDYIPQIAWAEFHEIM